MKKVTKRAVVIVLAGLLSAFALPVAARDLTVVNWGGNSAVNQRNIYYDPFTEETGVPVAEDTWSGGLGVLKAKVQSGEPDWDVVQVERDEELLGCEEGIYEKVDWSLLGGQDNFLPAAVGECGVGAIVWGIGMGYDANRIKDAPQSWADFWDLEKYPGKRAMRQGPKFTLEFALMADGVPLDQVYDVLSTPEGVDRAFAKLDEIKSEIIWWTASSTATQLLSTGEVPLSVIYSSRVAAANWHDNQNFKLAPDGGMYSLDYWIILKGSPNVPDAQKLIALMVRPENQAKYAVANADSPTNLTALDGLTEDVTAFLMTEPNRLQHSLAFDIEFWANHLDELTQRFNSWAGQ